MSREYTPPFASMLHSERSTQQSGRTHIPILLVRMQQKRRKKEMFSSCAMFSRLSISQVHQGGQCRGINKQAYEYKGSLPSRHFRRLREWLEPFHLCIFVCNCQSAHGRTSPSGNVMQRNPQFSQILSN